jgi:hypothetical protein
MLHCACPEKLDSWSVIWKMLVLFVCTEARAPSQVQALNSKFPGFVLISGHDGDDAPRYLEKQVRTALRRIQE